MPINFPDTPSVDDIFTTGSLEYLWTGSAWIDNSPSNISYSSVTNKPTEFAPSAHDHVISEITDLTSTAEELNILDGVTSTTTELNHTAGVTSSIQNQLDVRVLETNGAVTTADTSSNVVRNITLSTSAPSGGSDGDVWLVYEA
jgi:hypothetical protein